jgi:AraC-like DNA-binding protein/quercetin dioxygenase-like cupin family protein
MCNFASQEGEKDVGTAFSVLDQHMEAPRAGAPQGRLILSKLAPGRSVIGAAAPSIKMVLEGEELYQIDGRTLRVEPGQFLYLDAGTTCLGTNKVDTVGICLSLPDEWRGPGGTHGHDPVLGRALVLSNRTSAIGRTLEHYGREIARDLSKGAALAPEIVARAGAAVREPLADSRAAIEALKVVKASTRQSLFQRLERARGFLHDHDSRSVSLGELAAVANLSQFHLARYFRLAFGRPPIAYHRALRLARAAEYLAHDEGTIAEAAEIAGYSDSVSLCHAFRRHYGKAPRAWLGDALKVCRDAGEPLAA